MHRDTYVMDKGAGLPLFACAFVCTIASAFACYISVSMRMLMHMGMCVHACAFFFLPMHKPKQT